MKSLTILKIGGSVITNKGKECVAKSNEINRLAKEIASFLPHYFYPLILVHGAGSYGHPQAEKYIDNLNIGIIPIHNAVKSLNKLFIDSLNKFGISAIPVHPMSCTILKNGRIKYINIEILYTMIKQGFVPVLHGDIVIDETSKCNILSGDQIVTYLAKSMSNVETIKVQIGIGTNVDGVLDCNNKPIKVLTPDLFKKILSCINKEGKKSDASLSDVTGGMFGKVKELLVLAETTGIESCIFNASKPNTIIKFLNGNNIGTVIRC